MLEEGIMIARMIISVGLALVINFYTPEIPKNMKPTKNPKIKGFPYQYFKREVLTDEMIKFRIQVIYISFIISSIITFFTVSIVSSIVRQATFSSTSTSIEILSPN